VKTRFYREATAKLEEALDWYSARSATAEARFAAAVDDALESIAKSPGRFVKLSRRHRACRVIGFPYQIIYRFEGNVMVVVAVAHTSRRPGYWKRRR
jgi:plasmid stabilization system protein ParE